MPRRNNRRRHLRFEPDPESMPPLTYEELARELVKRGLRSQWILESRPGAHVNSQPHDSRPSPRTATPDIRKDQP